MFAALLAALPLAAQPPASPGAFLRDLGHIQAVTWTSPLHAKQNVWLLPLAATIALIPADRPATRWVAAHAAGAQKPAQIFGDASIAWIAGAPVAFAIAGIAGHDVQARNAGVLAGLALASAEATATGLKYAFMRERPPDGSSFWKPRLDPSFPSQHAAGAWATSTVIAHAYPKYRAEAYGVAALITLSRWLAQKHHPSDLVLGSFIGFGTGLVVSKDYLR